MNNIIKRKIELKKIGAITVLGIFMALILVPVPVTASWGDNDWEVLGEDICMGYTGAECTGYTGIGTDSPSAKLEVRDTSTQLILSYDDTNYANIAVASNGDLSITPTGTGQIKLQPTTDSTDFFQVLDANSGTPVLNVDSTNERVGIGTSSPLTTFDVRGSAIIGDARCSASGDYSLAVGDTAEASGDNAFAMGWETTASGDNSMAVGGMTTVASATNSVAIGYMCTASSFTAVAIGISATASGTGSFALGQDVTAGTAINTFVIGRGQDYLNPLVNNIEKSLMVGFDSTTPTFFVDGTSVGVGTTSTSAKLHIVQTTSSDSFRVDDKGGDDTPFIIDQDGNVGIGDTTPDALLDFDFVSTDSTGGTEYGSYFATADVGMVNTGTDTTYGTYNYIKREGATGGTINTYGEYIELVTDAGGSTHTAYGIYVNLDGNADVNYAGIFMGGNVGIGIAGPSAMLHVDQSSTTADKPVLTLDQADVSEEFIKFIGSASSEDVTQSIVDNDYVTSSDCVGWLKIELQDDGDQLDDQAYFIPIYTISGE